MPIVEEDGRRHIIPPTLLAIADEVIENSGAVCCGAYVASWHV